MRIKFFCVLSFFFLTVSLPFAGYGNTNTRKYCKNLLGSADKKYSERNFIEAMENLIEAKQLAEENNWTDFKIDALNGIGVIYTNIFDYDKAMEYYLKSYKIASKESDKKRELYILNNIAHLYFGNQEYLKAMEYTKKAYEIATYLNDSSCMGLISSNLASILHKIGDFELAKTYTELSLRVLSNHNDSSDCLVCQMVMVYNLYMQKKYIEAEQLGLSVWKQLQGIDHLLKPHFLLTFSKIYQEKGDIKKAIAYTYEALQSKPDIKDDIEIYTQLSDLYQLNGNYLLALQYKDSMAMAVDSLHRINNRDFLESNHIRFELINSERQLAENRAKQKAERTLFVFIFIFMAILTAILVWVFRIQSIRNKQQKIIAENGQRIAELELEKERNKKLIIEQQFKEQETLAILEQERLNNEIEIKNRQLTAQVLSQSNKKDIINEIIQTLSSFSAQSKIPELNSVIFTLKQQAKDSEHWNDFLIHFEQINPSFISILKEKHPDLNDNDIRFLSYIYLNLDGKKISDLLNISFDSLRKKKLRLANKMGVGSIDLYTYLINMSFS